MSTAERRDALLAAGALAAAGGYLTVVVQPSVAWSGDPGGLPLAAWLVPVAAVVAPWIFGSTAHRGERAVRGVLGALLSVGVMIFSPVAGAVVGLAWVVGLNAVTALRRS